MIVFFLLNQMSADVCYIMYALYQLGKNDIVEFLYGCLLSVGFLSSLLSYISIAYQRQTMRSVFDELQSIYDKCKFRQNKMKIFAFG